MSGTPAVQGPRACASCGARPKSAEARTCEYCGSELPLPPAPPAPPGPREVLARRFEALQRLPEYEAWRAEDPGGGRRVVTGATLGGLFGLVFAGVAAFVFVPAFAAAGGVAALFPLLFVAAGLALALRSFGRVASFRSARREALPALVADERTTVRGNHQHRTTAFHATLELPDGSRREVRCSARLAGHVAPGDVGVAHVRGGHLLAFHRAPV